MYMYMYMYMWIFFITCVWAQGHAKDKLSLSYPISWVAAYDTFCFDKFVTFLFFFLNYQHLLKNQKIWATPHINGRLNCFWNGGLPLLDHHLRCIFCRKSSQKMSKYVHQSWIGRNMMQRIYLQNNIFQGSVQLWSLYLTNIENIFAGIGRQLITEKK